MCNSASPESTASAHTTALRAPHRQRSPKESFRLSKIGSLWCRDRLRCRLRCVCLSLACSGRLHVLGGMSVCTPFTTHYVYFPASRTPSLIFADHIACLSPSLDALGHAHLLYHTSLPSSPHNALPPSTPHPPPFFSATSYRIHTRVFAHERPFKRPPHTDESHTEHEK